MEGGGGGRDFQEEVTFKPTLNGQHCQPHSPLLTPSMDLRVNLHSLHCSWGCHGTIVTNEMQTEVRWLHCRASSCLKCGWDFQSGGSHLVTLRKSQDHRRDTSPESHSQYPETSYLQSPCYVIKIHVFCLNRYNLQPNTFELKQVSKMSVNQAKSGRKSGPGRGNSKCKGPGVGKSTEACEVSMWLELKEGGRG